MRKNKKNRRVVRVITIVLLAAVGFIGWNYLRPLVVEGTETTYESYTVEAGSIESNMSFGATVALSSSETLTASEETTVRKIFVEESQKVVSGDKLIQLANGEILKASVNGVVNEIAVEVDDKVYPQTALMQICDFENMQVTLSVDEYDIDKVSVGQKCTITIMSLGLSFDSEISHINRVSASSYSVARYSATADVAVPDDVLPGMQATVSIPSARVEDVPVLDMNALTFNEQKQPCVLKKQADGTYEEFAVEVGLNDGLFVEIKNGLSVGDVVYAVSGTVSVEPMFSLQDIYNAIAGEKVVINDMSGMMLFGGGSFDPANLPEGWDAGAPPEGFDIETMPGNFDFGDMGALPDGVSLPGGSDAESEQGEADAVRMERDEEIPVDETGDDASADAQSPLSDADGHIRTGERPARPDNASFPTGESAGGDANGDFPASREQLSE